MPALHPIPHPRQLRTATAVRRYPSSKRKKTAANQRRGAGPRQPQRHSHASLLRLLPPRLLSRYKKARTHLAAATTAPSDSGVVASARNLPAEPAARPPALGWRGGRGAAVRGKQAVSSSPPSPKAALQARGGTMAAASRKVEERNERIVRGLLKLPPNRRCVNCNGLGPQYVCTSFWTFVCVSCSGIHREFTHRVKSVSMSTFSTQEVEALQKGGNQRAKESFLKDFDMQKMRLPDSSNIGCLREFIKAVYVERRYAGGRFSERPPRDKQSQTAHEEHRRASSYHSFSQSPPYDNQYEERHAGKQSAFLSRKPGSDRGREGKISGFAYSAQSLHERMSEDGFAGESCGSRSSNCSGSSMSDTVKTAPQSPSFIDNGCFSPHVQQDQSNVPRSYGLTSSQRTVSTGNIDIIPLKSGSANQDLFNSTAMKKHPVTNLDQSVDLFANMPTTTPSANKVIPEASSMDNSGWATFDTPPEEKQPAVTEFSNASATSKDKHAQSRDLFSFEANDEPAWFQSSKDNTSVTNQPTATSHNRSSSQPWRVFYATSGSTQYTAQGDLSLMTSEVQEPKIQMDKKCSQLWHSFDGVKGVVSHYPLCAEPQIDEQKNAVDISLSTSNPFMGYESHNDDSHEVFTDGFSPNTQLAAFTEPPLGGASTEQIPLNPFDIPFDTHSETSTPNLFMDISLLQEALSNPDMPPFLDGLPETWLSSSSRAYVPSASHGGLPCLVEQAPSSPLRNIPVGTVSTGNPFA
ncbi:hypothetical protein BS78_01G369200 [Paspalum vaginatum]|nr:hypothetical protein BS78_01G369200 [Paspalum vaginatum]